MKGVELQIFIIIFIIVIIKVEPKSSVAPSMSVWWSPLRRRLKQRTGARETDKSVCVCVAGRSGEGWASTGAEQQESRCHGDGQEEGEGAWVHGEPCSGGGCGVG